MREEMLYLQEYENKEAAFARDWKQMQHFYQGEVGVYQEVIEAECDKLEYNGSLMYAEVLDIEAVYRLVEYITAQIATPDRCGQMQPWICMMLCNEMHKRRCRKCRRDSMFCNCYSK